MRRRGAAIGSAVFFVVGPGVVAGVVPWLLTWWEVRTPLPYWLAFQVVGVALLLAGVAVLVHAFVRFVQEGIGTPLPAAAPSRLVVGGLYRYVRNPMYVALLWAIVGQALLFGQLGPFVYGLLMWTFAASYVRFREEPMLVRRFGADYEEYRRHVPAWFPRPRPWQQDGAGRTA